MNPAIEVWHASRFARCGACRQDWTLGEGAWAPGMSCPNCGTVITEGAFFGRYQAARRIDVGGLGEVMEAIDSVSGRTVAMKTLRHELFQNPAFLSQFEREAITLANLAHPNIVEVYEFFQDRGIHLLAMEYLDHGTLLSRVRQGGPVPERDLLRIGIDAVRGLTAALAKGVLHRDIKPANILFDAHGRAKLVDFGLALPIDEALAATGGNWGSPYYVPPERIENLPEDFRGDIYSLGVTLFHAASGRTPFQATSASAMAWKHLKAQHVSVKTFARHLSEPTAAIINRCMERRPDDRFQSYFDLLDTLESAEKLLVFRPPTRPAPAPDLIGASNESAWALRWAAIGATALALLAGAFTALRFHAGGPDLAAPSNEPAAYAQEPTPPPHLPAAPTPASASPGQVAIELDSYHTAPGNQTEIDIRACQPQAELSTAEARRAHDRPELTRIVAFHNIPPRQWTRVQVEFVPAKNGMVNLILKGPSRSQDAGSEPSVYWDDAEVSGTDGSLSNGGMEDAGPDGSLLDWRPSGPNREELKPIENPDFVRSGGRSVQARSLAFATQTLKVKQGAKVTVSAWAYLAD